MHEKGNWISDWLHCGKELSSSPAWGPSHPRRRPVFVDRPRLEPKPSTLEDRLRKRTPFILINIKEEADRSVDLLMDCSETGLLLHDSAAALLVVSEDVEDGLDSDVVRRKTALDKLVGNILGPL